MFRALKFKQGGGFTKRERVKGFSIAVFRVTAMLIMAGCGGDNGTGTGNGTDNGDDPPPPPASSFTDERDNQTYDTVRIGNQVWMAKNLNYETSSGSYCYDDNTANCDIYGRLYTWSAAMGLDEKYDTTTWGESDENHRGVCPVGWHLPNNADWDTLMVAVGGVYFDIGNWGYWENAGEKLKSKTGWNWNTWDDISGNGTDAHGFSALPGGDRNSDGGFNNAGYYGY